MDRMRASFAHREMDDPNLDQAARILNWMAYTSLTLGAGCLVAAALQPNWVNSWLLAAAYTLLMGLLGQVAVRRRNIRVGSLVFVVFSWVGITHIVIHTGGIYSPLAILYFVPVLLAGILLHRFAAFLFSIASITSMAGGAAPQISQLIVTWPIPDGISWFIYSFSFAIVAVILWLNFDSQRTGQEKAKVKSAKFEEQIWTLASQHEALAQLNAERTAEISRYLLYMQVSAEVNQVINAQPDLKRLSQQIVDLLLERFGLCYAGIFLVDSAGHWAVLHAGTGETGRALLAAQHRIEIGTGMVGWSIANNRPRVTTEASADAVRLATPTLPLARAEAALPMRSSGKVVGAITLQSIRADDFTPDMITALQVLVDGVATVLPNLNLQDLSTGLSKQLPANMPGQFAMTEFLTTNNQKGYLYDRISIKPVQTSLPPLVQDVMKKGQTICSIDAETPVASVPIKIRGQVVGVLNFQKARQGAPWKDREIILLEQLTDQLGIAMDSARLYLNIQRQAYQEQLTGEITARMRESLDVDTVLRTAVDEIYRALSLEEILIQVIDPEKETV